MKEYNGKTKVNKSSCKLNSDEIDTQLSINLFKSAVNFKKSKEKLQSATINSRKRNLNFKQIVNYTKYPDISNKSQLSRYNWSMKQQKNNGSISNMTKYSQNKITLKKSLSEEEALSMKHHKKIFFKFRKLMKECQANQVKVSSDIKRITRIKRKVNRSLTALRNSTDEKLKLERLNAKLMVKYMRANKPLFIYGQNGNGRYINTRGIDTIKVTDLVLKLKPEYKFLNDRIDKYNAKEDNYFY